MSLALTDWMRHDSVITIRTWNWVVAVAVCAWLEKLATARAPAARNALKVSMTVSLQVGPQQRHRTCRVGARQHWDPRSNGCARQAPSMMSRMLATRKSPCSEGELSEKSQKYQCWRESCVRHFWVQRRDGLPIPAYGVGRTGTSRSTFRR
ncbi:MAG: hypothetical protein ACN6RG_05110 [Stenotrophomonas sp.]